MHKTLYPDPDSLKMVGPDSINRIRNTATWISNDKAIVT